MWRIKIIKRKNLYYKWRNHTAHKLVVRHNYNRKEGRMVNEHRKSEMHGYFLWSQKNTTLYGLDFFILTCTMKEWHRGTTKPSNYVLWWFSFFFSLKLSQLSTLSIKKAWGTSLPSKHMYEQRKKWRRGKRRQTACSYNIIEWTK